jgi:acyl-coenzyme A synthetase/AMP-(fatty) acid ligase
MHIDFLLRVFEAHPDTEAIIWRGTSTTYREVHASVRQWQDWLREHGVAPGTVVAIRRGF